MRMHAFSYIFSRVGRETASAIVFLQQHLGKVPAPPNDRSPAASKYLFLNPFRRAPYARPNRKIRSSDKSLAQRVAARAAQFSLSGTALPFHAKRLYGASRHLTVTDENVGNWCNNAGP
jgi:hypothetical protein